MIPRAPAIVRSSGAFLRGCPGGEAGWLFLIGPAMVGSVSVGELGDRRTHVLWFARMTSSSQRRGRGGGTSARTLGQRSGRNRQALPGANASVGPARDLIRCRDSEMLKESEMLKGIRDALAISMHLRNRPPSRDPRRHRGRLCGLLRGRARATRARRSVVIR